MGLTDGSAIDLRGQASPVLYNRAVRAVASEPKVCITQADAARRDRTALIFWENGLLLFLLRQK